MLLFLAVWVPGAALDTLTTEIARQQGIWQELNPTGFVSLTFAIERELLLILLASLSVLWGAWLRWAALSSATGRTLEQFCEGLFQERPWAVALLGMPLFIGLGRYVVVISNVCYLTLGWSPVDLVSLQPLEWLLEDDTLAYVTSILVGCGLLWFPVTSLIFRLLFAVNGGREGLAQPVNQEDTAIQPRGLF